MKNTGREEMFEVREWEKAQPYSTSFPFVFQVLAEKRERGKDRKLLRKSGTHFHKLTLIPRKVVCPGQV